MYIKRPMGREACIQHILFFVTSYPQPLQQAIMDRDDVESQVKEISSHEIENVNVTEADFFTSEEEKALVRKVDFTLLPTIWIMYLLSYLDRTK